jgi:hypothetical protein
VKLAATGIVELLESADCNFLSHLARPRALRAAARRP